MQECNLTGEEKFAFKVARAREKGAWLDQRATELILPNRVAKVDSKYVLGYYDPELASLATASPTLARTTRSILFALGAHRQWPVRTLDARAAFLAGDPHHARHWPLYM